MDRDRRQHRRLAIRLPLEYYPSDRGPEQVVRTVTLNISSGGLYFELDLLGGLLSPELHSQLDVDLTVPPGDGYFPYQSRLTSVAEVVRCDALEHAGQLSSEAVRRVGIAARFRESLKVDL